MVISIVYSWFISMEVYINGGLLKLVYEWRFSSNKYQWMISAGFFHKWVVSQ